MDTENKINQFTIILPVRNGGEYVKECIKSIQDQTVKRFDFIVLDNNSTDGTVDWIETLRDDRITIIRSDKDLTIEENWARTTSVAKTEFVTLIGHDDILMPDYLETMQELISKHPDASLYQTHFDYIDASGKLLNKCKPMDEIQHPHEFLSHFLCSMINTMGTGFMMRTVDYDRIGGMPSRYPNLLFADFELWIRLTQISYKATSFKNCFSFRLHTSMTTSSADIKLHKAFSIFIQFLTDLKSESPLLTEAIERYGIEFIDYYCKGLAHRLLRTPLKDRNNLSVKNYLETCKEYAAILVPDKKYDPFSKFNIRLAKQLDSFMVTRALFLLFKMIYKKPIY